MPRDRRALDGSRVTTVLIAETSQMDCQLLADAIQRHGHLRVLASATSSSEVLSCVQTSRPDVAVISAKFAGGAFSGLQLTRELHGLRLGTRIVILIDTDEHELVVHAFRSGAKGVFCRTESSKKLGKCIEAVHQGQIWANSTQLECVVDALMQTPALSVMHSKVTAVLSKREEQVCQLAAAGLSNREIARKLELSEHTVKNHLFRMFDKLGVSTRVELVLYALRQSKLPKSASKDAPREPSYKFGT